MEDLVRHGEDAWRRAWRAAGWRLRLRLAWAADSGRLPSAPGEAALAAGFAVRRLRYSLRQRVQGNAAVVVSTILLLTVNLDGGSAWLAALAAVLLAVSLGNIAFEVWREPRLQRVRWGP